MKLRFHFKIFFKLIPVVIDLLQNNYDGCQQQVADEEALIGTEQEMTDMVKNELRRLL